jgi:hypothetical protein
MESFLGTPLDQKYIGLAKLLYSLRQDLDVYCLISVNARAISEIGTGQNFFGHIQRLSIEAISLNVCKIFEGQKRGQAAFLLRAIQLRARWCSVSLPPLPRSWRQPTARPNERKGYLLCRKWRMR